MQNDLGSTIGMRVNTGIIIMGAIGKLKVSEKNVMKMIFRMPSSCLKVPARSLRPSCMASHCGILGTSWLARPRTPGLASTNKFYITGLSQMKPSKVSCSLLELCSKANVPCKPCSPSLYCSVSNGGGERLSGLTAMLYRLTMKLYKGLIWVMG